MDYELSATNITDTTVTIVVEALTATTAGAYTLVIYQNGIAEAFTDSFIDPAMSVGDTATIPVTGLTANTAYEAFLRDSVADVAHFIAFTTKKTGYDDPKTATQEQWEDLVNRIKQAPAITMTTTDPGEGTTLAANNFIGVYE